MAHYDLEEQEQIDSIKTWWKMYGNLVSGVILAGSLAVIGWQGWNWYQRTQAAQASAIYGVLEQAVAARDAQRVKAAAGELAEKFGGTSYAALGALVAARQSFEAGDLKTAKAQLSWAADKGKDELKDLARLRLAAVLLDEKAYDEALKQLDSAHAAAFAARFLELKGDVLAAQGKKPEARTAYKAALDKGEVHEGRGGAGRELLRQKLENLGEAA
ncbi:MAG TPA: tetratricopeptide repeat protein [Azonexus sp.]|nr:tetratricopeptide repeat protein [Azonexus sp.]